MQVGDLENQTTEDCDSPVEEPTAADTKTTPQPVSHSAQQNETISLWQRLRDRRREVAAIVTLVLMAGIWFDSGNSKEESKSVSLDPLDGYEAVLSDFTSVDDDRPLKESADPFDFSSGDSFSSGPLIPQSPESAGSNTASTSAFSAGYGSTTRFENTTGPENTRAFNAAASGPATRHASDPQLPRRVRFAGRIQPAH